jgi:hypothetical protein
MVKVLHASLQERLGVSWTLDGFACGQGLFEIAASEQGKSLQRSQTGVADAMAGQEILIVGVQQGSQVAKTLQKGDCRSVAGRTRTTGPD